MKPETNKWSNAETRHCCQSKAIRSLYGLQTLLRMTGYGEKTVEFDEFTYGAGYWRRQWRRMVVKAERTIEGAKTRFVVTSLMDDPRTLYTERFCARGEMENQIKEQQYVFSGRTSCHLWWPTQFRLLLSGLA